VRNEGKKEVDGKERKRKNSLEKEREKSRNRNLMSWEKLCK
jgi:hypothetical protein